MRAETLAILCSPIEHASLEFANHAAEDGKSLQFLVNREHGLKFPIQDGIPIFVDAGEITGLNSRFRGIYDRWAPYYDLLSRVGLYVLGLSEHRLREEFVGRLGIRDGDRVLSTSVGTGTDLAYIPRNCDCHGLDLSAGMLRICRSRMEKLGFPIELYLGQAEYLPFRDGTFDVVYQMGGINFFNDQAQAIRDMVRVARTGAKIVIMDETEKVARALENVPGINAWFRHQRRPIVPPWDLVPQGMQRVESCELYDGKAWHLSFRKPR